MAKLKPNPPAWCAEYIGKPFEENARGDGADGAVDCWGLVRLIYARQFGIMLPVDSAREADHADGPSIWDIHRDEVGSGRWESLKVPENPRQLGLQLQLGDVLTFRCRRPHIAIVVGMDTIIHATERAGVHLSRISDPAWWGKLVGVYRYTGPVDVSWRPNPLIGHARQLQVPEGLTIADILGQLGLSGAVQSVRVMLSGSEVPRAAWDYVRPRAGRQLQVVPRFAGDGDGEKSPTRTLLTVAVIAAAIGVQAIPGVGQIGGAFLAAGVGVGGGFLLDAIAPIRPPELDQLGGGDGVSATISGARNQANPFGVVPVVMGRHRIAPPYGAKPYTEIVGDDQYLRLYFIVSGQPVQIEDMKVGSTPLDDLDDYEIEVRHGYPDEDPITLFPFDVSEEQLSVNLEAGVWQQRTTAEEADEISVDVTFPIGLATLSRSGSRSLNTVLFDVEYSPSGMDQWVKVRGDDEGVTSSRMLSAMFRPPSRRLFRGYLDSVLSWSDDGAWGTKPAQAPGTRYAIVYKGFINLWSDPEYRGSGSRTVEFSLDSGGTAELRIQDQVVVGRYGNPEREGAGAPDFTVSTGTIEMRNGWQPFELRMDVRDDEPGAIAIGVKYNGQASAKALPENAVSSFPYYTWRGEPEGLNQALVEVWNTSQLAGSIIAADDRTEPVRRSLAWAVERGQYDVRIRRVTADPAPDDDSNISQSVWTAIRSIDTTDPVDKPGLARIALRIRATDQLNGVIDTFNLIATSVVPDYDALTGEWIERGTSNPASLYRSVLQGRSNKRPLPDDRLDIAELELWHQDCEAKRLYFSKVFDTKGTVQNTLQQIASAGRASPANRDSLFSVARDRIQTTPVQHFTPRNSRGFRGQRRFPEVVHGFLVRFIDETDGAYAQNERLVLDDGYQVDGLDAFGEDGTDLPEATEFETIEAPGVTNPDQVFVFGRFMLAQRKLRPELFTLATDVEHLACRRGDLVKVTHDVPLIGSSSGRILRVIRDGNGDITQIELDEPAPMVTGNLYALRVRLQDGASWYENVVTSEGEPFIIDLETPFPGTTPGQPKPGDLFQFGIRGLETRDMVVQSIEMDLDLAATLTLVDYAPGVFTADTEPIPDWDPGITDPPDFANEPEAPVIEDIRSDDYVMVRSADGSLQERILVRTRKVTSNRRPRPVFLQARHRKKPTDPNQPAPWRTGPEEPVELSEVSIYGVEEGVTYDLSVRHTDRQGRASAWVNAVHTVIGKSLPPPDLLAFNVQRLGDGTRRYTWEMGDVPPDVIGVRVRYGPQGINSWESLTPLQDDDGDTFLQGSPTDLNRPDAGEWTFAAKAVDTSGNESANALFIDVDLGPPRREGVAFSEEAASQGWPGVKFDCFVEPDTGWLRAVDTTTWDDLTTWDAFTNWNPNPAGFMLYTHPVADIGALIQGQLSYAIDALGDTTVEVRTSEDNVTWTDWAEVDNTDESTTPFRYVQFRASVAAQFPNQNILIREFLMEVRAQQLQVTVQGLNTATVPQHLRIGTGDIRLPVGSTVFSVISSVSVVFTSGLNAGWTWVLVDKLTTGPRIQIYNADGELADTTIDAVIRGL